MEVSQGNEVTGKRCILLKTHYVCWKCLLYAPQADERVLFDFNELRPKHNITMPLETPVGQVWSEKDC